MTTPTMHLDCDGFTNAFADYLEGDAPELVRLAVEAHAATCAACGELLADVQRIRSEASALPALTPSRDLWSGIAPRIDTPVIAFGTAHKAQDIPRRRSWFIPALAAAALVGVTAGTTYYVTRASMIAQQPLVATAPEAAPSLLTGEPAAAITAATPEGPAEVPAQLASVPSRPTSAKAVMGAEEKIYDGEITKLRQIMKFRASDLDPKTVLVLEQSLAVIDSAIVQSRAALASDPASGFLATQLNRSLEKKVELLRTAVALPART